MVIVTTTPRDSLAPLRSCTAGKWLVLFVRHDVLFLSHHTFLTHFSESSGLNPYDVRKKCDRNGEDGPLCYKQMQWIEAYLNNDDVKAELGAPANLKFDSCNMQISENRL